MREPIGNLIEGGHEFLGRGTYTLKAYTQVVVPADKHVYLVKSSTVDDWQVDLMLHYDAKVEQRATETIAVNSLIVHTRGDMLFDPNKVSREFYWVGETPHFKFMFNALNQVYDDPSSDVDFTGHQPGVYYYTGDAIYPKNYDLFIDNAADYQPITTRSNSFPFWLDLQDTTGTIYPAYQVPANRRPPYIVIDSNDEEGVETFNRGGQTTFENVTVTLFGFKHDAALNWLEGVMAKLKENSLRFGLMNAPFPMVKDVVDTQSEAGLLTVKKEIKFKICYNKTYAAEHAFNLARLIVLAAATLQYHQ